MKVKNKRKKASSTKKKRATNNGGYKASQGNEDAKQRRKYARGGRIEAYTFGEALRSKNWP